MRKVLYAFLTVVIFCIMQGLFGVIAVAVTIALKQDQGNGISPITLAFALILSGLMTILICWKGLRTIELPDTFNCRNLNFSWALVAIVASLAGVFAGDLLTEIMELPNMIEDTMLQMAFNTWGILAVTLVGPVVEELLFREGICGYLSRNGMKSWPAIWISAILFGIIHLNPAQVPFAILMGLILGVIYMKTGSIVLTSIIHVLNNSFAVIQVWTLGDRAKDFSMVEWVGGNTAAGICIIVGATACFYLLRRFWEEYPTITEDETEAYNKNP